MRFFLFLAVILTVSIRLLAQSDTVLWLPAEPGNYKFIKYADNVIGKRSQLDSAFKKLHRISHYHKGRFNVVHIGDSHIQADGITAVLRHGFQKFFGDGGRGLVFPYQVAGSNAPPDVLSSSNADWSANRLVSPEKHVKTGISGFGIATGNKNATLRLSLLTGDDSVKETFTRMVFFMGGDDLCYRITGEKGAPLMMCHEEKMNDQGMVVESDSAISGFALNTVAAPDKMTETLYGVSLEKPDSSGVVYHTIGVNGARYDQYLKSELFWQQIGALHADLYILSMGTNEAQSSAVNVESLMTVVDSFINKIHLISPRAAVIITTPPVSYFKMKKPNASLVKVSEALLNVAALHDLSTWDLFRISGGKTGAADWKKKGLLGHDLVHFTKQGYILQGDLLLNAIAKSYNAYVKTHPFKTTKPVKKKK